LATAAGAGFQAKFAVGTFLINQWTSYGYQAKTSLPIFFSHLKLLTQLSGCECLISKCSDHSGKGFMTTLK